MKSNWFLKRFLKINNFSVRSTKNKKEEKLPMSRLREVVPLQIT